MYWTIINIKSGEEDKCVVFMYWYIRMNNSERLGYVLKNECCGSVGTDTGKRTAAMSQIYVLFCLSKDSHIHDRTLHKERSASSVYEVSMRGLVYNGVMDGVVSL